MDNKNNNDLPQDGNTEGVPAAPSRVGYGQPPKSTRFQKGMSGNPRGRPRGSLNVTTLFMRTLREKVFINENGRRRSITKLEAALKQLANKAAGGELRALRQLVELAQDAEQKQHQAAAQDSGLSDLDQEVMERILLRFQSTTDDLAKPEETDHDDDRS
jgi:Family of unknown function (DUF5681)